MEKKQKLVWFAKRCALALAVAALCYLCLLYTSIVVISSKPE